MYRQVLGTLTKAIAEFCPDFYEQNKLLGKGGDDCSYPTPAIQTQNSKSKNKSITKQMQKYNKTKHFWFVN